MPLSSDYAHFVRAQQDALLREFVKDPGNCFIGIPGIRSFSARYFGRGSVRVLPGAAITDAFMWSRGPGTEELWVKPYDKAVTSNRDYAAHWEAFVSLLGGGTVSYTLGHRAQVVDHLLPETFAARQGFAYVRAIMVDYRGNATVGSVVEKSMAGRDSPGKSMLADWFTAAKASCFPGSFAAAVSADEVMRALRAHLSQRNSEFALPAGEAAVSPQCMNAILGWVRSG